jgi:hypothetical protein
MKDILFNHESHPFRVRDTIKSWGIGFAYWNLRSLGASRYQAARSIFFALGVK